MMRITALLAAILLITACGDSNRPESTGAGGTPADGAANGSVDAAAGDIYAAAVANPERTDADRQRDAGRKPAEVMRFVGIEPGMDVLDLFSGGGYYTEMLAQVVGDTGRIYAHTNQAYASFVGDEAVNRYAGNRLSNVEMLMAENTALVFPDDVVDAVMMVLTYHDIYYVDPANGWPKIDGEKLVAELYDALRPGGVLGVVDHYAAPGSPPETGNTLHRIDPQIVIDELTAAGFVLEAESDVLRNPEDDHSLSMSAPEIRGKTDRFVLRFRKPD